VLQLRPMRRRRVQVHLLPIEVLRRGRERVVARTAHVPPVIWAWWRLEIIPLPLSPLSMSQCLCLCKSLPISLRREHRLATNMHLVRVRRRRCARTELGAVVEITFTLPNGK
jgi:hypothetical protein